MDIRAAEQYLDSLFGKRAGHVAVAYKDKGQSWQEHTFEWPKGRASLLKWAKIHADANIFICPALRQGSNRVKGDMHPTRWLWADVDWDKVPDDKQADVRDRIGTLGTLVVRSGSGDNVHVYVEMDRNLTVEEHRKLNTGLRDYLYADAKHADNSLLRLPGTTNWKTDAGSDVSLGYAAGEPQSFDSLMKVREFREAKADGLAVGDVDWELVELTGLPKRILRMAAMPVDEAVAKYGSRHKAVWAVTGELHKRGLDADMIHTLMDTFPAAVEKNDDEHNGYDVHKDVEKRLIWDRSNNPLFAEDSDEDMNEAAGEVFEEMSVEEVRAALIDEGVEKELMRRAIRKAADKAEAERGWTGPPDDASWSLTDGLRTPPAPLPYLIGPAVGEGGKGLAGAKHNVVVTAQYKTGKTTFVMGSLAYALADGRDFLGRFPIEGGPRVVGHWNIEMDDREILDAYIRPVGIDHTDNLYVANLRGHTVNILSDVGKQWAVQWLMRREVKCWTIDSLARLARMAGVSEKDNDEMFDLLMALDEIKVLAGVDTIFLITHTGRAEMEEGKERARGATAIDDWADARWVMTKMDQVRFLAVDGRGVALETTALHYDEDTTRYELGFGSKADVKQGTAVQTVVGVVKKEPGIIQAALVKALTSEPIKMGRRSAMDHIEEAITGDFIEAKREARPGGGRAVVRYYLAGVETGNRHATATPKVIEGLPTARGRRKSRSDSS